MNVLHRANTTGVTFLIICVHQIPVLKKSEKKKKTKRKIIRHGGRTFSYAFFLKMLYHTKKIHDQ